MNKIVENFNDVSLDLLKQMAPLIGKKYHSRYALAIKLNSSYGIDIFIKRVFKYKQWILNKDEQFFETAELAENSKYEQDIQNMRELYKTLDHTSRKSIWEILTVLIFLAEKRHSHLYETL
jgi:hypothetical protein